jgi:hypothetical protein
MTTEQSTCCPTCGSSLPDVPLCYGADAPWRQLSVAENEFSKRVELTGNQCIIDDKQFFIRGHIDIPVLDSTEVFSWSVWCSLSEKSFWHASKRWRKKSRVNDDPYFGWLMTCLPVYPDTLHLETSLQPREVGRVPLVIVEQPEHPVAVEQRHGITS